MNIYNVIHIRPVSESELHIYSFCSFNEAEQKKKELMMEFIEIHGSVDDEHEEVSIYLKRVNNNIKIKNKYKNDIKVLDILYNHFTNYEEEIEGVSEKIEIIKTVLKFN
jgi:hypothetical protein